MSGETPNGMDERGQEQIQIKLERDRKTWLEITARNHEMGVDELVEELLRYGLIHQDDAMAER